MRTLNRVLLDNNEKNLLTRIERLKTIATGIKKGDNEGLQDLDNLTSTLFSSDHLTTPTEVENRSRLHTNFHYGDMAEVTLLFMTLAKGDAFDLLKMQFWNDHKQPNGTLDETAFRQGVVKRIVEDYKVFSGALPKGGRALKRCNFEFNRVMGDMPANLSPYEMVQECAGKIADPAEQIRRMEIVSAGYLALAINMERIVEWRLATHWQKIKSLASPESIADGSLLTMFSKKSRQRMHTAGTNDERSQADFFAGLLHDSRTCLPDLEKAQHYLYRHLFYNAHVKVQKSKDGLGAGTPELRSACA